MNWNASVFTWGPLLGFTAIFFSAFAVFAVRSLRVGVATTARGQKAGSSPLLSRFFVEFGLWLFSPVIALLVKLRVHPNTITWSSLVLQVLGSLAIASGAFGLGEWVLLIGLVCDALDGAVARARGLSSDAGEVLDAAVDRWGEVFVFAGFAYYYRSVPWAFALVTLACAGAVMVSYTRAKAEALSVDVPGGLMQRHERATYLLTATGLSALWELIRPTPSPLYPLVLVALAVIGAFGNLTALRRVALMRAELSGR
jgi:CDP-diacylglycerol--glycerol-3-phosphate 3-phosphatidyltransferase